uniref:CSON003205 protein n=1 Tax=Culicoides sonorensis TaxID=179676 RepID=A0A336MM39_CULSO
MLITYQKKFIFLLVNFAATSTEITVAITSKKKICFNLVCVIQSVYKAVRRHHSLSTYCWYSYNYQRGKCVSDDLSSDETAYNAKQAELSQLTTPQESLGWKQNSNR